MKEDFHETYRELPNDFKSLVAETIQTDILGYEFDDGYVKLEKDGNLTMFVGFLWSASGPTIDSPWTRRGTKYHDALYYLGQFGVFKGKDSKKIRKKSDKLLHSVMKEDANTPKLSWYKAIFVLPVRYSRCRIWYTAVRLRGHKSWE